jgi:perosamine synthetase
MIKPQIRHDLEIAYGNEYGPEEETAVIEAIRNKAPSCGKKVKEFENAFARYCGSQYALTVTSATAGLTLAGKAVDIRPGDEVVTTPISWISTATAFSALGARVVFCDVNPHTLNMDPAKLEQCITHKTKAIVPVHLFGQCCDMDEIAAIARRHSIAVIEDCAHCPGSEYKGKKAGTLGDIGVFSFHQQKNMSTLGEGGMVTTGNRRYHDRILSFRSLCCRIYGPNHKYLSIDESRYPMGKKYWALMFDDIGYNFRMTDVQAAAGIEQLKKLDSFNAKRREIAAEYTGRLQNIPGLELPAAKADRTHIYHLYVIQVHEEFGMSKEELMWKLYTENGIKTWSNYMPIHCAAPYRNEGHGEGECPVAEAALQRYVSLPIHPRLTDEAVTYLTDSIKRYSALSKGALCRHNARLQPVH